MGRALINASKIIANDLERAGTKEMFGWGSEDFPKFKACGSFLNISGSFLLFWLLKIIGLGITAVAISMGGPFWFDLLGKVIPMRGTGSKPTETSNK